MGHHQRVDFANPGDNVGLNIKGLDKNNMPRSGDVMEYKKDTTLGQTTEFAAQIQFSIFPTRSRSVTPPSASCAAGAPRAASRRSSGRWARRLAARRWRNRTH